MVSGKLQGREKFLLCNSHEGDAYNQIFGRLLFFRNECQGLRYFLIELRDQPGCGKLLKKPN